MKNVVDLLLNGYEHIQTDHEFNELCVNISKSENKPLESVRKMLFDWINNKSNVRTEIELNYHLNPKRYDNKLEAFIKEYL